MNRITMGDTAQGATITVSGMDLLTELNDRIVGTLALYTESADLTPTAVVHYDDGTTTYTEETEFVDEVGGGDTSQDLTTYNEIPITDATGDRIFVCHSEPFDILRFYLRNAAEAVNLTQAELNYGYSTGAGDDWTTDSAELEPVYDNTISDGVPYAVGGEWIDVFWQRPAGWGSASFDAVNTGYWVIIDPSAQLINSTSGWAFQLAGTNVRTRTPIALDLAPILAYAPGTWPTTWDDSVDGATVYNSTTNGSYIAWHGETVLGALVKIARNTGERFRIGTGRRLEWLRKVETRSNVVLSQLGATGIYGYATTGEIQSITETTDTPNREFRTRIYPYGAGNGLARITLQNVMTSDIPSGYSTGNVSGLGYYLQRDAAVTAYGVVDREVQFKEIHGSETADFNSTQIISALLYAAHSWLERNSYEHTFYD
ncbi:hypothetical protein KKB86_07930, partial [bacterium]|nr:hypothetical protein [bacterium]